MPKYKVIILPLAEKDITQNTDYILYEKNAPEAALKLLNGFEVAIFKLVFMPERYQFDEDEVG